LITLGADKADDKNFLSKNIFFLPYQKMWLPEMKGIIKVHPQNQAFSASKNLSHLVFPSPYSTTTSKHTLLLVCAKSGQMEKLALSPVSLRGRRCPTAARKGVLHHDSPTAP
jgi:hypothetical protein